MSGPDWLPDLIRLTDYEGDWRQYIESVYAVFRRDFIEDVARCRGDFVRVGDQSIDGKERTFWHITSEGNVEQNRVPDLRRCERIGWVRAIIDHDGDPTVLCWPQMRGRKRRHILWMKEADFAVVLEKRPGCWWLWTAYPTERQHTREKLLKEYDACK
ncbi:MAG: hypothetical protein A2Z34_03210 [Planctomycetes bacterium RBG_16_59_8]|nr:MAG: hypothetical protein A2Z34_03210 [Planctomycetes bacterium RBG_16_59_8]